MGQPPLCIDCDKEIPFERYRLGVCPECMEERALSDPNWHRSTENADELPPETFCRCGHKLAHHDPIDLCPCTECDCEEFDVEPSAETLRSMNRGD